MLDPSGEYRFLSNDYFVDGVSNFRDMYITVENGNWFIPALTMCPSPVSSMTPRVKSISLSLVRPGCLD